MSNIQIHIEDIWNISCEIAVKQMPQDLTNDSIGSFLSSDNKPLLEPMLINFYDAIWRHWATKNSPVSQWFSPSGEQHEQRKLTHTL